MDPKNPYEIVTLAERPDLRDAISSVALVGWPEFMVHCEVANRLWSCLGDRHPECQYAMVERGTDQVVAMGNSVPVCWKDDIESLPAEGVEWALTSRFEKPARAPEPHLLCALQIVITDAMLGKHKSGEMVLAMRRICEQQGLDHLIAPVRPNWKPRYPLVDMERYIRWTRDDGLPYDPWMRVHVRLGASMLNVCPSSLIIEGRVAEWEGWTGMRFPESGTYYIPGALVPVEFDLNSDRGRYTEPNIWMLHP